MIGHHFSESKQKWVAFSDMHDNHLHSAMMKLGRRALEPGLSEADQVGIAAKCSEMREELELRGWALDTNDVWQKPNQVSP